MDRPELVAERDHLGLRLVGRLRRDTAGERRGEDERLERRPGLPLALDGEVELALREARAADHREHPPVPGIDGDERRLRPVLLRQPLVDRIAGELLEAQVDGRVDLETAAEHLAGSVVRDELSLHVLGKVLGRPANPGQVNLVGAGQRPAARRLELLAGDQALAEHQREHRVSPLTRRGRARDRVVGRRVRRDACKECRFGQSQLARVLVEVDAGRHLDPVRAVPEVDGVQVRGQDPVLGPAPLELPGERRLLQLPADGALGLDVRVLDELLRDGRAALDDVLVAQVGPDRAEDPAEVDSPVLPEAAILDCDDRLLHDRGDLLRGHDHTALVAAQDGEDRAVRGVDVAVALDAGVVRRVERGDVVGDRLHEAEGERGRAREPQHAEEQEEAELADPAPGPRGPLRRASSSQHEEEDSTPGAALPGADRYTVGATMNGVPVGASTPPARSSVTATVAPAGTPRESRTTERSPPPAKSPAGSGVSPSITQIS